MIDLIYEHPQSSGKIFQTSYREIPHDLKTANIQLVIFAAAECPPLNHHQGATLEYHPNEDSHVSASSPAYTKILASAIRAANSVAVAVKAGKNVLITCNQGINRSSLVTALALTRCSDLTAWDAINLIKEKRQGTLTNGSFMTMILSLK